MQKPFKLAVICEGYFEEVISFETEGERNAWSDGASYGADQYGGDGFCTMTKEEINQSIIDDPEWNAEAFKKALVELDK